MEMNVITEQPQDLRKAIENLMTVKLYDALARPDGLLRLAAHRSTGVASSDIRHAERELDDVLRQVFERSPQYCKSSSHVRGERSVGKN
jgi:hypothetical protein